ncbi:MAG: DinB family protein [Gemmatimonadota bacterium]
MNSSDAPTPASPAYVSDTLALLGELDPLEVLAETPDYILSHVEELDEPEFHIPEGPGKWSLAQVFMHLADAEIAFGWRARLVLTQDNAPMTGYDQSVWMERFDGANTDAEQALDTFLTLRDWNMRVWRSATDADLSRIGVDSERGPESFDLLRRLAAGHDLRHRRQVDRILAGIR